MPEHPHPQPPPATPRFDTVDVLRGLAIIAVVLLHTSIRTRMAGFRFAPPPTPWLYHLLFWNGDNGVTVFFAISGFLITLTSLRRFGSLARMRPRLFYRIRFARIAPLLLILLAVLSALHFLNAPGFRISPQRGTFPGALFAALTFHLNAYEAAHGYLPANWDVLWSLSVEEVFYFFFPLACVMLLRFRRGWLCFFVLLAAFIACGPFARTVWNTTPIAQEKSYLGGMDGIALGCLCALVTNRRLRSPRASSPRESTLLLTLQIAGSVAIFLVALWPSWPWMKFLGRTGLDSTVLALGTCFVMYASVMRNRIGRLWTAPIRWFGRHSYEIYLTHEFLVLWGTMLLARYRVGPLSLWFVAILLASAPVGFLVATYISEPLNRKLRGAAPPPVHQSSPAAESRPGLLPAS